MEEKYKTLEDLGVIPDLLWDSLDVAAQNVQAYFKEKDVDRSLSPCLMRYYTRIHIKENLWKADGLILEQLANNGIALFYKNHHMRIWKKTKKDLPSPGTSLTKDSFLRQENQQFTMFLDSDEERSNNNLALLWDTNEDFQLKELILSRPKYSAIKGDINSDWSISLEHPVSKKRSDVGQENNAFYDLPLEELEGLSDEEENNNESGS